MTKLAADLAARARRIVVDGGAPPVQGGILRIGDEALKFLGFLQTGPLLRGRDALRWNVKRGQLGTTRTTHASGADVIVIDPAYTEADGTPYTDVGDLDAVLAESSGQDIADALTGAAAPDETNVFATMGDVADPPSINTPTADQKAALDAADAPDADNPFATIADVGAGGAVNWIGAWDSGTTYQPNDGVTDAGSLWIALAENTNDEPPSDNWLELPISKPTLAEVLAAGNDAGGAAIIGLGSVDGSTDLALRGASGGAGQDGHYAWIRGGAGDGGEPESGEGAVVQAGPALADGTPGRIMFRGPDALNNVHYGQPGQVLVPDGNSEMVWGGIPSAEGVPSGAPDGTLPFAYDTTAVSGGMYFWNGAAWVKITNIL